MCMVTLVGVQAAGNTATYIRNTAGTDLPAKYRPPVNTECYCRSINNVALSGVFLRVYDTGEIRIFSSDAEGNFGAVGTVGFYTMCASYCV